MGPEKLVEIFRGDLAESCHFGHLAITDNRGNLINYWGNPDETIYPRSSCKMIQALPLIESGSADHFNLGAKHLALACASHSGGITHLNVAKDWLGKLNLEKADLLCGSHKPDDIEELRYLKENGLRPTELHNNCSGKHLGFLTISKKIPGSKFDHKNYLDIDHPVQKMVKSTFEEMTDCIDPKFALDGCSAPNFCCSVRSLARSMAILARPEGFGNVRKIAINRLQEAVIQNPHLIAGENRLCTKLMKRSGGRFIVKVGAEGVYTAILLREGLGLALKISDGARRAAECLIVTILVRLGLLDQKDDEIKNILRKPIINWANHTTGILKASDIIWQGGKAIKL
ncbi:MAG: asparaginase [Pseudomonadota bacterium]|nr:asparaginase [Pseudomonadota bacterium]